eukprot:4849788-Ditylum_brightwellii.AAC.1
MPVTHSKNIESAIDYFEDYNFKIKDGNRYLGGYLGEQELAQASAVEKVTDWVLSVHTFSDMMGQQPQASFAGFTQFLQCKWAYLQQSMELTGDVFDPLEEAIHDCLFPALFKVPVVTTDLQDLVALTVWHGSLGALNPTKEAPRIRTTSKDCTSYLMEALLGLCIFEADMHATYLEQGGNDRGKGKEEEYEHERKEIESFYTNNRCQTKERVEEVMNNSLMVVPHTANNS